MLNALLALTCFNFLRAAGVGLVNLSLPISPVWECGCDLVAFPPKEMWWRPVAHFHVLYNLTVIHPLSSFAYSGYRVHHTFFKKEKIFFKEKRLLTFSPLSLSDQELVDIWVLLWKAYSAIPHRRYCVFQSLGFPTKRLVLSWGSCAIRKDKSQCCGNVWSP